MSSSQGFEVDPATLTSVATDIDGTGSALFGAASKVEAAPDAGRSTGEVFKTMGTLGAAVAALAQDIGQIAESTGVVSGDFVAADQGAADAVPDQPAGPGQP